MDGSAYQSIKEIGKTLVVLSAFVFVLWITNVLWRRRKLYIISWKIHGPIAFPLIGSSYKLFGDSKDILTKLMATQECYPGSSTFWFGPKLMIFISNPVHMGKLLNNPKCLGKDDLYEYLAKAIGHGLLTAPVEKWKRNRKIIIPSFNIKVLESFVEIFAKKATIMIDQLKKYVGQTDFDLNMVCAMCTMDSIFETAIGVPFDAQTSESSYARSLDRMFEIAQLRIFRIWYRSDFLWQFLPIRKEFDECLRTCRTYSTKVIRIKREAYKNKLEESVSGLRVDTEESKRIKASLDLMLENSALTEEELREEVDTLIAAGTDTSSAVLTFLFMCLGMFQDIQENVYNEVMDIMGPDRKVEPSDLPKMKYLEMVVKETLRIFPVIPYILRHVDSDIDLGDIELPKGVSLYFPILNIHRDPNLWPEPLQFRPERFLPENVAKRHPCTYIPFSTGIRNCLGYRYALMNIKTTTAMVLRKYKFFCDYKRIEDVKLKTHIVIRPADGAKVRMEFR